MQGTIGNNICLYRQKKKMTQEEFASRLGVTPQAVSKWERGNGLPDTSLIAGICNVLGISAGTLLGMEDKVLENDDKLAADELRKNMIAEPLVLEFGTDLVPWVAKGLETYAVYQMRVEMVRQTGILVPIIRFRDNAELKPEAFRILSYDEILYEEIVSEADDKTFSAMVDMIGTVCKEHYDKILNKQLVKQMIDNLKEQYPGIADDLIPERISYLEVEEKLRTVLQEKGSIRDLIHIIEELEEDRSKKE